MTERIYFTYLSTLKWYCLKTLEIEEHKEDKCVFMSSCLPLEDGKVLVHGTLEFKPGTKNQFICLFSGGGKMIVKKDPNLGMAGLQMVNIGTDVFYISGNRCEKFCLITNDLIRLENLNFTHIKGGCCRYNNTVLVVSGINCPEIEMLSIQNYWVKVSTLPTSLFEISCVQVGDEEILCINKKRTYRVNIETGTCFGTANYTVDINIVPVMKGDYVYSLNLAKQLIRYSLNSDKWENMSRGGCCFIF